MAEHDLFPEIRKLRKKLRQIENLENVQRPLTPEEQTKVQKKQQIRSLLQEKLKDYKDTGGQEVKPRNDRTRETKSQEEGTVASKKLSDNIDDNEIKTNIQEDSESQNKDVAKECKVIHQPKNVAMETAKPQVEGSKTGKEDQGKSRDDRSMKSEVRSPGNVKPNEAKKTPKVSRETNPWDKVKFSVIELSGHNDVICSVDCFMDTVISGSRDTSVKVWDAKTGSEVRSLGGHTDSVTGVELVPQEDCPRLANEYEESEEMSFLLSCSLDCSLRLWVLQTGELVKSIYTFNGVLCMGYIRGRHLAVLGYTGGKVELWDLLMAGSVFSSIGHEEAVTSLKVSGNKIVTASADGMIKLWELRDNSLHPIFVSENVKPLTSRMNLIVRKIHTTALKDSKIYFGDDGQNVKVLDWREGKVHKMRNHKEGNDFGFVDAIIVIAPSNYLVCSGYNLDFGSGYLNIFSVDDEKYLATLTDDEVSRIFAVACGTTSEGGTRLITGGSELKVWDTVSKGTKPIGRTVSAFYNEEFCRKARDSEDESYAGSSDEDDEIDGRWREDASEPHQEEEETSWWWCSIL